MDENTKCATCGDESCTCEAPAEESAPEVSAE